MNLSPSLAGEVLMKRLHLGGGGGFLFQGADQQAQAGKRFAVDARRSEHWRQDASEISCGLGVTSSQVNSGQVEASQRRIVG